MFGRLIRVCVLLPLFGMAEVALAGYLTVGDADNDFDIDLFDISALQQCFSGPYEDFGFQVPTEDCINNFDVDYDNDVDLADAQRIPCVMDGPTSGEGRSVPASCDQQLFACDLICEDLSGIVFSSSMILYSQSFDQDQARLMCKRDVARRLASSDLEVHPCPPDAFFLYCSCYEPE